MAECTLAGPGGPLLGTGPSPTPKGGAAPATAGDGAMVASVELMAVWGVSGQWLRGTGGTGGSEQIASVAVDCHCRAVAGTTRGRAVALRRSVRGGSELVPAGALWSALGSEPRREAAGRPLQLVMGGCLIIAEGGDRIVRAINMTNGQILGEWKLPEHSRRSWTGLAGGQGHLFAISSSEDDDSAEMWRFPLPDVLRARLETPGGNISSVQVM
eukprot:CAMPEP_0179158092 /NCGR_PEP_ID=MMETSP0796-20121207/77130_1 /TAXON_ID=73915 /ORGANISM="Pyrodinium bahamense, Strain pbaha01" /LENGTH=213 /DNA_ID=CAMNT_0020859749 /DNA_START=1 /DNA_END=642 /DNA_ORIENTATION=-